MTKTNTTQASELAAREPYEAPAIDQTADFERLMVACGHQPGNEGAGGPCDPGDMGSVYS